MAYEHKNSLLGTDNDFIIYEMDVFKSYKTWIFAVLFFGVGAQYAYFGNYEPAIEPIVINYEGYDFHGDQKKYDMFWEDAKNESVKLLQQLIHQRQQTKQMQEHQQQ